MEDLFLKIKDAEEWQLFLVISSVKVSVLEFEEQKVLQQKGEEKGKTLECYSEFS
jgi:hypothetical protein